MLVNFLRVYEYEILLMSWLLEFRLVGTMPFFLFQSLM
jgi:hypothetical protein